MPPTPPPSDRSSPHIGPSPPSFGEKAAIQRWSRQGRLLLSCSSLIALGQRRMCVGCVLCGVCGQVLQRRAVAVPAKAHFLLDEAATQQPGGFHTNKTASFFFAGRLTFGGRGRGKAKGKGSSSSSEGSQREAAFKHFNTLFRDAQGWKPPFPQDRCYASISVNVETKAFVGGHNKGMCPPLSIFLPPFVQCTT